jgi:hypothetical protein
MLGAVVVGIISFIWLIISKTAFIWAPIFLMYLAFELWHHFVTERFILGMRWTVFEVQVPRDVEKTPMAMELIFSNAFYHASAKGIWETWIQGAPHFWFSLEIAGIDGNVHFFVRTPSRIRDLVETQIYAQYPQSKVREVEDYTLFVPYDAPGKDWYVWGCEFALEKHDAYPIRTYKDYGLDKPSDKEQQKIDPLTPTIEYLGSLKKGQQIWLQHVIRPSKKTYHTHGTRFGHHGWVEEANNQIDVESAPFRRYLEYMPGDKEQLRPVVALPAAVENRVRKMAEKTQKLGFDVGIRVVVVCDAKLCTQEEFDGLRRSVRLLFRQFNNPDGNSLLRINATQFDAPWADPAGIALWKMKNRMLNWFRLRVFFHPPLWYSFNYPKFISMFFIPSGRPQIFVLNVEELATLFHFPGQVSQAPSFRRIDSRVAKPPANLPI